jgi:hypothetical protein
MIESYSQSYIYLNHEVIREKGLDQAAVEKAVVDELMKFDGVALAVSSSALSAGYVPNTPLIQSVLRNYNPRRFGDVFVVFQQNYFVNEADGW